MIVLVIIKKVKTFFCIILNLINRCFCCLRRKYSSDDYLPVTVNTNNTNESLGDNCLEKWDSWDGPSSVVSDGTKNNLEKSKLSPMQQQIYEYRLSQQIKLSQSPEEIEEPNYFEDLAPKISKKAQVIILARPNEEQQVSNRLSMSLSEPHLQGADLLEWNEDGEGGWEEEAEEEINMDAVLREQKEKIRQERKAERLKKKAEREISKQSSHKIAMKLS